MSSPIVLVVEQHAEDAVALFNARSALIQAPHVKLHHLARLDERLAAHLDGLKVAGDLGSRLALRALERPGSGEMFVATATALTEQHHGALQKLLAVVETEAAARAGLAGAFGWVSAFQLRDIAASLLASSHPFQRHLGLVACALHRVDPGAPMEAALTDPNASLRAQALRIAGELGRVDLRERCLLALADPHDGCRFQAARSALLLGDRRAAVTALEGSALSPGPRQRPALRVLLKAVAPDHARALLTRLTESGAHPRVLVDAIATSGDVHYAPWLLEQMQDPRLARLCGEAFCTLTGLDLAALDFDTPPPENLATGPNDEPDDTDVALDEDDGLAWPDADKLNAWWQTKGQQTLCNAPTFIGKPPTSSHCLDVLKTGFQRQRIAAAQHRCLIEPGTALFNTSAPARRQQRLLAAL
ncbi:TIGR02270 family protein [Caldimonas brevitalea]|uniref:TIGR02270 family protein n=1 Tax=Caldimonas brevitalea TaxID=413882 RepID=A0A0G3BQN2_9BURK|nr:TIGR02270 family protein [Caldimonas brevitalea]AKJ29691.1 hypothetical protein AAW51_3000 [Caldimonas brevitalea]